MVTANLQAGILTLFWRYKMTEEVKQISVAEMLRLTGTNSATFMDQVAVHIENLEEQVATLTARIAEFESKQNDIK